MTGFCVIAVFPKEPCARYLRAAVCYCAGNMAEVRRRTLETRRHVSVELFFGTEAEAMCYVRRINGGRLRYDAEMAALVDHIEREEL